MGPAERLGELVRMLLDPGGDRRPLVSHWGVAHAEVLEEVLGDRRLQ
jgi:hypothetical protein